MITGIEALGSINPELEIILVQFRTSLAQTLGDDFIGLYLGGSLALGGFDPASSDIDFLVITATPPTAEHCSALSRLHRQLDQVNRFGAELEGSYITAAAVRHFRPDERHHPKRRHAVAQDDEAFGWWQHRHNALLDLWIVREHGIILHGPDPKSLIAPIAPEVLRDTVRAELAEMMGFWTADRLQTQTRYYLGFLAIKLFRALYTLKHGAMPTKQAAMAWAATDWQHKFPAFFTAPRSEDGARNPNPALAGVVLELLRTANPEHAAG